MVTETDSITALNMTTLSAFAAERALQATGYRSLSAAGVRAQQQTSRTPLLPSIDGTDGRTPDRCTDLLRTLHRQRQ